MNDFRQYILVGGMPQSVLAYRNCKDFEASDTVKRRILQLYREDISKFDEGYEDKVYALFDNIPGQLSRKKNTNCHLLKSMHVSDHLRILLYG